MSAHALLAIPIGSMPSRTVVIRHNLPDGSHHFDWLLARDSQEALPLIAFRMESQVDKLSNGERATAQRIADHRQIYLDYEGSIAGQRGHVTRMRAGRIVSAVAPQSGAPDWTIVIEWQATGRAHGSSSIQHLHVVPEKSDAWSVVCVTIAPHLGKK